MLDIGTKIKNLRLQNDLTLADLASRCELTVGFLSQLENNLSSPSISTLNDILEALGTNLSDFFRPEEHEKKVFNENDFFEDVTDNYIINWLVPDAQKRDMEPIRIELFPHKQSQIIKPSSGEEFGYVLEGKVTLVYGKEKQVVKKGETFYIDCHRTHYLKNDTNEKVKIIWVSTPPNF